MKFTKYQILNFLFIITLGKFFFQWILPTNPSSRTPLWRVFSKTAGLNSPVKIGTLKYKLIGVKGLFIIHMLLAVLFYFVFDDMKISLSNILANFYPMWVQVYIGLRCYWVIKRRRQILLSDNQNLVLEKAS